MCLTCLLVVWTGDSCSSHPHVLKFCLSDLWPPSLTAFTLSQSLILLFSRTLFLSPGVARSLFISCCSVFVSFSSSLSMISPLPLQEITDFPRTQLHLSAVGWLRQKCCLLYARKKSVIHFEVSYKSNSLLIYASLANFLLPAMFWIHFCCKCSVTVG